MATCAFAIIKNNENKILLVQIAPPFREDHKWNFPGEVIEDGEEIPNFLPSNFTAKVQYTLNIARAILHSLLKSFGKYLSEERDSLLRYSDPLYIRSIATAPEEKNSAMSKWHCDGLSYIDVDGKVKIGMIPTYGRLVVSLDTFMRSNVDTNTSFIDGDFVVKNVVQTPEAKSVEELEFNDHNITTVTEGTGGILTINDTTFTPDQDKVRSFGMARINDIGSTTLHAAQELDDAMRVTLQCDYLLV